MLDADTLARLCRAREQLRETHDSAPSIRDIAHGAGLSPYHFIRRFAAVFGETPHQFRIGARLDRAKLLLAAGEQSVTDVCLEVGFGSLGSFSDAFARRVGRRAVTLSAAHSRPVGRCSARRSARRAAAGCLSLMCDSPQRLATAIFEKRAVPALAHCAPMSRKEATMRIKLTSIFVDDQDKALRFYTKVLGFVKKREFPVGEYKWITVVSPEGPDDLELSLEPNANPAARTFQESLMKQGIPLTAFEVSDIEAEHQRLGKHGVVFTKEPTDAGPVSIAIFADTCGNLIQIYEPHTR